MRFESSKGDSYSPERRDCIAAINISRIRIEELKKLLTKPKEKGQRKIVEEIAIFLYEHFQIF